MNPPLESYRVGDVTVTRIPELLVGSFTAAKLLPDWQPGDQPVEICTHAWLVRTPQHTVLVDTGVGNGKSRAIKAFDHIDTPFLESLAAAGVTPEAVDRVLITHLHSDHVGWNTRLVEGRWQPTFSNARTLLPRHDLERVEALVAREGEASPKAALYVDSIRPVLEAGRVELVDAGHVLDGFAFHATPGHCAGHMSIELSSAGERALFAGDVMHHPIQVARPEWSSVFSEDPARGEKSRRWALEWAADTGGLVFSSHFPASGAGRVGRAAEGFTWTYV